MVQGFIHQQYQASQEGELEDEAQLFEEGAPDEDATRGLYVLFLIGLRGNIGSM